MISQTPHTGAIAQFLEAHGSDMLCFRGGAIVIETYYDKKFRALGGDTDALISLFEDYCNIEEASRHYLLSLHSK